MQLALAIIVGLMIFGTLLGLFGLSRFMYKQRKTGRSCGFLSVFFFGAMLSFLSWVIAASQVPMEARNTTCKIAIPVGLIILTLAVASNVGYFVFEYWREEADNNVVPTSGDLSELRWIANITQIVKDELGPTNRQLTRIEERLVALIKTGT